MGGEGGASGVPHGAELTRFVDAVVGGDETTLAPARSELRGAIGDTAFVDACATVASFNAVVKLADGTGIPLEDSKAERTRDIREALSIDDFRR